MRQDALKTRNISQKTVEENNNIIQQASVEKRGWRFFFSRFFYMLALSIGLVYTMARFSGVGILNSIYASVISIIFFLPVLFIIGFALAMWRFRYSVIYFIVTTLVVNIGIFISVGTEELSEAITTTLWISAIEIPVFLGVTLGVFALDKIFIAIPQRGLRITLAILPFVIMLITIFSTYFR